MADPEFRTSRHILLSANTKSLTAEYDPLEHSLVLSAEGDAGSAVHDVRFIRLFSSPGRGVAFALKGWGSNIPAHAPYQVTERFRMLQPIPGEIGVLTEQGQIPIQIKIRPKLLRQDAPAMDTFMAPLIPDSDGVRMNENVLYTTVGSTFSVKETIRGGSLRSDYDLDFVHLLGAQIRDDTIYYEFRALRFGKTEVEVFRLGSDGKLSELIVDIVIMKPGLRTKAD